jgi:hypothetical protein
VVLDRLLHALPELVVGLLAASDADDPELVRQQPAEGERVERRDQFPLRQVTGRAKDRDDARIRRAPDLQTLEEGILLSCRH